MRDNTTQFGQYEALTGSMHSKGETNAKYPKKAAAAETVEKPFPRRLP